MSRDELEMTYAGQEKKEELRIDQNETSTSETNVSEPNDDNIKKSRGVVLMESINDMIKAEGKRSKALWIIIASIWILNWATSLDQSTTSNFQVYATSDYGHHTFISTLEIATSIIGAVGQLCFAKFSDVTSRPLTFIVALALYVIGYVIIPAGKTISSYIVGTVFGSLGHSILGVTTEFIIGDLTPLKWRGFGIGFVETPNIINPWFAGLIVDDIVDSNWRWGYGMFTIIVPVALIPAVCSLFYYQRKASKIGIVQEKSEKFGINIYENVDGTQTKAYAALKEIDIIGLLLLGTSLSLILLPLSLYRTAENSWKNPSIIAMFIVGGILLIAFAIFEIKFAPFPCIHKKNFNRTVITEILFNLFYFIASKIATTYLSSFVLIYKDWNNRDWTYFNKTVVITKSVFSVIAGLIQRRTRRYKFLQMFGICIEIISYGLLASIKDANTNTATLVMSRILGGIGLGFAVYSSRLAIQVAVSHQNMTMGITTVFLFTSIGKAIGSAIAAAIWNSKTPNNLRKYMPASVSDEQVSDFFGNLRKLREYPMGSPIRTAAIDAYVDTSYYLFTPALGIIFISFLVCFFQKNYYLGDGQNAVEPSENNEPEGFEDSYDFVEKLQAKLARKKEQKATRHV